MKRISSTQGFRPRVLRIWQASQSCPLNLAAESVPCRFADPRVTTRNCAKRFSADRSRAHSFDRRCKKICTEGEATQTRLAQGRQKVRTDRDAEEPGPLDGVGRFRRGANSQVRSAPVARPRPRPQDLQGHVPPHSRQGVLRSVRNGRFGLHVEVHRPQRHLRERPDSSRRGSDLRKRPKVLSLNQDEGLRLVDAHRAYRQGRRSADPAADTRKVHCQ